MSADPGRRRRPGPGPPGPPGPAASAAQPAAAQPLASAGFRRWLQRWRDFEASACIRSYDLALLLFPISPSTSHEPVALYGQA